MTDPTKVVLDKNGNLFTVDSGKGSLIEVPAGSTTPVTLYTGLGGPYGVAVDASGDVIASASYNGHVYFFANNNGIISTTPVDLTGAYGFGGIDGYYAAFSDITVDKNNVVYMSTNYCNSPCSATTPYAIFSVQTQGPATTSSTINVKTNAASVILYGLPKIAMSLAVDTSNHLYYADGANVYVINLAVTPKVAVKVAGTFTTPDGVTVDALGNLYVSDYGKRLLYEIPNESGVLNPADQFIVANPTSIQYGVAFDNTGGFYSADGYASGSINKTLLGGLNVGSSPVATAAASASVTFAFNGTVSPTAIALFQGTGTATEFTNTKGGNCAATAYTAGQTCTVQVGFTPASTGVRKGAVVLQGASGVSLGTAYLGGAGTGAALTVDPGMQAALAAKTGWITPSAVALDAASNIYVADSGANVVQVISSAGSATATIGSGLSKPAGVAVDGAGNVLISDTGNNRIVEVPNEGGTLNTADQSVIVSSGLSSPQGIAVDRFGTIYVADSGNKRVLSLSTIDGLGAVVQTSVGSGFTVPAGVATDGNGNLYVTDSAANQIDVVNLSTGNQTVALGSMNAPTSISIDASGSAYVVNSGTSTVLRIPNVGGSLNPNTQITLGSLNVLVAPSGVAVNGSGNVAIVDSGAPGLFTLVRTSGALGFGSVDAGLSSLTQNLTLTSAGTGSLILGATPYTQAGSTSSFTVTSSSNNGCTAGSTLTVGATCGYAAVFSPANGTTGALADVLTFSSNAANAANVTATLSGTATNLPQTSTTLLLTPANPYYGQAVTVTATVTPTKAGNVPTGTVTFYVDGIAQKPNTLACTTTCTATYTFPALTLTASTHAVNAGYSGDANNASSDVPAALIIVITREPSVVAASVTPTVAQPLGSSFSFAVRVTPVGLGSPTGTVQLVAAGTTSPVLASGTLTGGATTLTYAPTALGNYQYQVLYSGDVNFLSNTSSGSINISVQNPGYIVTLPSSGFTVAGGQTISIPMTITGISGYAGNVTVGGLDLVTGAVTSPCTGLPAYVTCTFSPGIVSLAGGNFPISNPTGVINLTLGTSVPPAAPYAVAGFLFWPGGIASLLALGLATRRRSLQTRLLSVLFGIVLCGLALGVSGCGNNVATQYVTPKGTTAVTLTFSGTPLGGVTSKPTTANPNLTSTTTFQLTVQ